MEWCPDGEKLLTATTAPRLRIGNGFKVWHYSGALLHETPWPTGQELLQVTWQKYDENVFKEMPISNVKVQGIETSQPQPSKAVYVPPNIRSGGVSSVFGSSPRGNHEPERGPIPGLPVGYKVSQGQRKKERNTKRKETEPTRPGGNTNTNSNPIDESGGKARSQNASTPTQSNNRRIQQRTSKQSNNQNHTTGNGASANNQNNDDSNSNSKTSPNTDPNFSGTTANEHSNQDSDEARKAKRERQRNKQRKSESGSGAAGDPEKDKRIRTVQQKLKDISKLKVRRDNGENLEVNQLSKIKMECDLVKELSALKVEA